MKESALDQLCFKHHSSKNRTIGMDPKTEKMCFVDDVERGLSCGCVCPACRTPLIARKGEQNQHHFAHANNIECYYGYEISVYLLFVEVLREKRKIYLPKAEITLTDGKKKVVGKGKMCEISEESGVEFRYEGHRFPPAFRCTVKEKNTCKTFFLVLNIDEYFTENDQKAIYRAGKEDHMAVLMIDIHYEWPTHTKEHMEQALEKMDGKTWIYNELVEKKIEEWKQSQPQEVFQPKIEAPRKKVIPPGTEVPQKCPDCGGPVQREELDDYVFYKCKRYPECKFIKKFQKE